MKEPMKKAWAHWKWPPKTVFLLIVVGIGLIVVSRPGSVPPPLSLNGSSPPAASSGAFSSSAGHSPPPGDATWRDSALEAQLASMINAMPGVAEAQVMIVFQRTAAHTWAEQVTRRESVNESRAQPGASGDVSREMNESRQPVILRGDGGRTEQPLVSYSDAPVIGGVLVVIAGDNQPALRRRVTEAVAIVLDVAPHRIDVIVKSAP